MSTLWTGSIVSVDCGDVLGVFEGEISNVDDLNQTLSLINVSRNSTKCQVPEVTLSTLDIKSLKLIESTVKKNKQTNTVEKSAFSSPTKNGCSSSPVLLDSQKKKGENKKKNGKRADPKKWLKERDEACFSATVDSETFDTDFDFEKNLALFDKKAVFEEISALCKMDHVKLVDCNKKGQTKYRHDENVLNNDVPILKQISVSCQSNKEYVTDSGLVVPSVTMEFKNLLYEKAELVGLTPQVRLEMIGRAATEMVLQLVGGCHRLTPQNTHQRPTVVILCGLHVQGAQAVNCGRQLANHCVNVSLLTPSQSVEHQSEVTRELKLYKLSDGNMVYNVTALPPTVDIILDALEPHSPSNSIDNKQWLQTARAWAKQSKAPVMGLDPPPDYVSSGLKYLLTPVLPLAYKNDQCSIYICDIGLPKKLFDSINGCTYSSPFGSKFVIPLYLRNDQR
ncbi:enhancer of mRNA-decapping protein 3 [Parasteatoda tepidariorum]|uniref:enhancer of mRNA-decapping protein 3 n=1 Tax=Parasteatoda tepidariorum TaxID=114398 RepID=UPI001C727786|nr:enhancer of mRNA-decapping protein 3 [Parasteatoda tepidariorum]